MNPTTQVVIAIFLSAALLGTASLVAAEPDELKERIRARASRLTELYERGSIREGPDGLLRAGSGQLNKEQQDVLERENSDRKSVITAAAKASGLSESEVAARFAERAAKRAPQATNRPIGQCRILPAKTNDVQPLVTRYRQAVSLFAQGSNERALAELTAILAVEKNFVGVRQNIAAVNVKLRRFKEAEAAMKDEIQLLNCLQNVSDSDLNRLAYMFATDKPAPERSASQTAHIKALLAKGRYSILYNLACLFAVQNVRSLAVTYLTQSVQNGFSNAALLQQDPDLANIRNSQEFQEILWAVQSRART